MRRSTRHALRLTFRARLGSEVAPPQESQTLRKTRNLWHYVCWGLESFYMITKLGEVGERDEAGESTKTHFV